MVEPLPGMPPGTYGFRVSGRLTHADYSGVLVPPLRRAVEAGERLRVLYAIGPELDLPPAALLQDLGLDLQLGIRQRGAWERIAVLSDIDWLRRGFGLFAWLVPGQVRLFGEGDIEQAKRWLAP